MSLRSALIVVVALAALGLAWQQRELLQRKLAPAPVVVISPSRDAVRPDASPAPAAATGQAGLRPGALRKCVNGTEVSYTNVECPAGHKVQAVTGAPVNVVPATPVARAGTQASAPSALHQALDMQRDDTLRDRMIERAVDRATR